MCNVYHASQRRISCIKMKLTAATAGEQNKRKTGLVEQRSEVTTYCLCCLLYRLLGVLGTRIGCATVVYLSYGAKRRVRNNCKKGKS